MAHQIGKLHFDIYYLEHAEKDLDCKFQILQADGKHLALPGFDVAKSFDIDCVLAELYLYGWQMIQLKEDFNLDEDGDPEVWFREAYFHRPFRTERD